MEANQPDEKMTLEKFREEMERLKEAEKKSTTGHFMLVDPESLTDEDREMWQLVKAQRPEEVMPAFNQYKKRIPQDNKSRLHYAAYLGTLIQYKIFGVEG